MHAGEKGHARPDNIKTWTGLPVEESIGMTEDSGESASTVWPTFGSRTAKERNRTGWVVITGLKVEVNGLGWEGR